MSASLTGASVSNSIAALSSSSTALGVILSFMKCANTATVSSRTVSRLSFFQRRTTQNAIAGTSTMKPSTYITSTAVEFFASMSHDGSATPTETSTGPSGLPYFS